MNPTVFIFDFDGTIADTHQYMVTITNRLADEFKFNKIQDHEVQEIKHMSAQDVMKHLKIPTLKVPQIVKRGKEEYNLDIKDLMPFAGLKEVLLKLKELQIKIGILSSNSSRNIQEFLKNHDFNIFDFVYTTSKIWTKNTRLKRILKEKGIEKNTVLYIGDETRDVVAAKRLGVKVAAVTWGYNSAKILSEHGPDYLIESPQDLIKVCQ